MTISIDTSNCIATRTSSPRSSNRLGCEEGANEGLARSFGLLGLLLVLLRLDALLLDCENRYGQVVFNCIGVDRLTELLPADGLRVRVQAEEDALVDEGVLVLRPRALLGLRVRGANDRLDLVAVDDASDIGVGNLCRREAIERCG